jgi:TP901 family phage tail tape measure protein
MTDFKFQMLIAAREELSKAAGRAGEAMGQLEKKFDRLRNASEKLNAAGRSLFTAGAGLLAGVGLGVKAFSDLEQSEVSLKNVLGTVDGMDKHFDSLSQKALKLGNTLPGSTKDFYDLIVALRKGGQEAGVIDGGLLEATANLKVVQRLTSEIAGEGMATTANAFHLTGQEAIKFADILNRTANSSRLSVPGLFEAMKYAGSSARMLGWEGLDTATQMSTVMGALSKTGIDPSQVGTAISQGVEHIARIKTRLSASRGALWGEAGDLLRSKGISLDFFDEKGEMSIPRMVAQLEKLKGLTKEQRLLVGTTLFGAEGSRLALVGTSEFNQQAKLQLQREHLNEQVKRETQTLAGRLENTWGTFSNVAGRFFAPVAEGLKKVLNRANELLERFDDWQKANPKIAAGLVSIITGFGMLLAVGGGFILFFGKVFSLITSLAPALSWLGTFLSTGLWPALVSCGKAVWALGAAFMSTPIGWITAAIVALIVVGIVLWKNWDRIAAWFKKTFPGVSAAFGEAWAQMKAACAQFWNTLKPLLSTLWEQGKAAFAALWKAIQPLVPLFAKLWEIAKPFVLVQLKIVIGALLLPVIAAVAGLFVFVKVLTQIVQWANIAIGAVGKILSFFTAFFGPSFKAGVGLLEAFTKGIVSVAMKPVEAVKSVVTKLRRFLPFSPAKEGPLSDIHKLRLFETIAESMNPRALVERMASAASMVRGLAPRIIGGGLAAGGGLAMAATGARGGMQVVIHVDARGSAPGVELNVEKAILKAVPLIKRELERASGSDSRRRF